ncbi:MAG TPA: hypothetical protein VKZ50_12285 [bacterium]|nr:hypothetical protein [bacterium]
MSRWRAMFWSRSSVIPNLAEAVEPSDLEVRPEVVVVEHGTELHLSACAGSAYDALVRTCRYVEQHLPRLWYFHLRRVSIANTEETHTFTTLPELAELLQTSEARVQEMIGWVSFPPAVARVGDRSLWDEAAIRRVAHKFI